MWSRGRFSLRTWKQDSVCHSIFFHGNQKAKWLWWNLKMTLMGDSVSVSVSVIWWCYCVDFYLWQSQLEVRTIDRWIIQLLISETAHVLVQNIFLVPLFSNIFNVCTLQETVNHTCTEKQETLVFHFVFGMWKGSRDGKKYRTNFTKLYKNEAAAIAQSV